MRARTPGAVGFALLLVLLGGCTAGAPVGGPSSSARDASPGVFASASIAPLVAGVPKRTVTALPAARLASGLLPPTNRWFSGLVFGTLSMPVFPLPLGFQLTGSGFAFGLPTVTARPAVITGGFAPIISADVGADSQVVTAYDTASVTISQRQRGAELGRTVIAEGSPFVSFAATKNVTVTLGAPFTVAAGAGAWTTEIGGNTYGLVTTGVLSAGGSSLRLSGGESATWFVLASGGSLPDFVTAAGHPLTGTRLDWSSGGARATTSISYATVGNAQTIVAALPHQISALAAGTTCAAGTYPSVYGTLRACTVTALAWSTPTIRPSGSLDLSKLSTAQRVRLAAQVAADLVSTRAEPADTYYGGKWLYRLVNLLEIAKQVGADDAAAAITTKLIDAMDEWTDPKGCSTRDAAASCMTLRRRGSSASNPPLGRTNSTTITSTTATSSTRPVCSRRTIRSSPAAGRR